MSSIPNYLQNLIDSICKDYGLKAQDGVQSPVNPGVNYLGTILELNMLDNKTEKQKALSVIAKLAPTSDLYRSYFPIRFTYEREIYIYNSVLPVFAEIQKKNNIRDHFRPFAKCYHTLLDEFKETLLLENMTQIGYRVRNHRLPLDYQHAALIMTWLGKLHALSFALREQNPDKFGEIAANIRTNIFSTNFRETWLEIIKILGNKFLKTLDDNDSATYIRFQNFIQDPSFVIDEVMQADLDGNYAVICHGDLQIRNLLFKYEDQNDSQTPTHVCFLDWQLCMLGSPIIDLSFFIWICTDKEFRNRYYKEMLALYYSSFSDFLTQFGLEPKKIYPKDVFENILKKKSVYGLFTSIWVLVVNLTELESVPDASSGNDHNSISEMFSKVSNNMFYTRMKEMVDDFIKYGYDF